MTSQTSRKICSVCMCVVLLSLRRRRRKKMADDCHMHVLMPATRNLRQFIKRNSLFLKQAINNCWLFSSGFPNTHMHLTMYTYNNAYNIYSLHRYFFLSSFHFSCSRLKYNRSIVFRACVVSSIAESLWFAFCFFVMFLLAHRLRPDIFVSVVCC